MEARAAVLLPLPLPAPYDYALPAGIVPKRGMLVRAPLGTRELVGVVWGKPQGGVAQEKLRLAQARKRARAPWRMMPEPSGDDAQARSAEVSLPRRACS